MKRKLLFAMLCIVGVLGLRAQEDVTVTYLTNADFSSGTVIDNNVCTYGKDMKDNGTTYYGAQAIEGWTNASVGETADEYPNCKLAGALFAYGSTPWLAGSGTAAPATDPEGNAGNAAGLCAVWGGSVQYTQDVTLQAGCYTIQFDVYNATTDNSSGKIITSNLFGFVPDEGSAYYAPNNTFAIGQWTTVAVSFKLEANTSGKISMGYVGPSGNAAMPHLFVDNVKILKQTDCTDYTSKVGIDQASWTNSNDGMHGSGYPTADGRTAKTAAFYGSSEKGRVITQTVSGLESGMYEVALYAISQNEWNNFGASLTNDEGDAVYVFAEGKYELKSYINARRGPGYPSDGPGIYTISGVTVADGNLTLGIGIEVANKTEWQHVQIKSLTRVGDVVDLDVLKEAYETAMSNAQAIDQTKKMAPSILSALQTAISTNASVDETSASAMTTATEALITATSDARTSIASYEIIASGTVSTSNIEGWTCTNAQSFHINTWSSEGNPGNDPSGMTTPFIENWRNKNDNAGLGEGTISYTLKGLEPGEVYYAQALIRAYNEKDATAPNGPDFYINDKVTKLTEAGTPFTYNGMSGIYATLGAEATVGVDGKITLGAVIGNDANYNWVAFKNVSIQELGAAYDAAVAKITAQEGYIPSALYTELYKVVTDNPTVSSASIAAIEAAVGTYDGYKVPYAEFNKLKACANAIAAVEYTGATSDDYAEFTGAIATQSSAADAATTIDALNKATADLREAIVSYVTVAIPTSGNKFDLTCLLTNPNLEGLPTWKTADGWYTDQPDGNSQVMENDSKTNGAYKTFFEYWSSAEAPKTDGYTLYMKVNLPKGVYSMACQAFAEDQRGDEAKAANPTVDGITFSANDVDGSKITSSKLEPASISFYQQAASDVKLGLRAHKGNTRNWMGIGYVTLFKVANDQAADVYATVLASAKNMLASEDYVNVTGQERTDLAALATDDVPADYVAAIEALQGVITPFVEARSSYDAWVKAQTADYEKLPYANNTKYDAITAAKAAGNAISATDADAKTEALVSAYRKYVESNALAEGVVGAEKITVADDCMEVVYDSENHKFGAWQVIGQTNGAINLYDEKSFTDGDGYADYKYVDIYKNDNNAGIEQTVNLKPGKYLLTVTARGKSTSGATFYVFADGVQAGIPRTDENGGVFGLGWNDTSVEFAVTETSDVKIGVQSGNGKDLWWSATRFRLVRLGDAPVFSMDVAAKSYATFVAPFEVEIPDGVTASTVTGVEDNKTTLKLSEPLATIPANTPVVLFNDNETVVNKGLTNSGALNIAKNVTVGLLTGVYTETDAPVGSYVLQNRNSKVAFYIVAEGKQPKVQANHAYLTVPAADPEVKAFYFGNIETAIQSVKSEAENGAIYNLAGQRVGKAQKGIFIQNGKKVVVK